MRVIRPGLGDLLRPAGEEATLPGVQDQEVRDEVSMREVRTNEGMGLPAKIWGPLPRHADSGHIHVAVLTSYGQVRKPFPSEELIRDFGSLTGAV